MNFYQNNHFFEQVNKNVETDDTDSEWIRIYFSETETPGELCVCFNLIEEEIGDIYFLGNAAKEDVKNQLSARQHIELLNYLCELNPFELESRNQVAE